MGPMLSTVYILTRTITNDNSSSPKHLYICTLKAAIYPLILLINEFQIVFVVYSRAIGIPIFNKGLFPIFPKEKKRSSDWTVSEKKSPLSYSLSDEQSDWIVSEKKSSLSYSLSDEQNSS